MVTVTGMVIVFSALVFVVFVMFIMGKLPLDGRKKPEAPSKVPEKSIESAKFAGLPVKEYDADENELAAVIVAAVYACGGENVKVTGVKPASPLPRSPVNVWAAAGIFENTRPFSI
jgi:sodium pump decarboxylase gamma subunit